MFYFLYKNLHLTKPIRKAASAHVQIASQSHEVKKLNLVTSEIFDKISYVIKKNIAVTLYS